MNNFRERYRNAYSFIIWQRNIVSFRKLMQLIESDKMMHTEFGLEELNFEGIVLVAVDTEILDLVDGNHLVLLGAALWGFVALGISSESSDIHLQE